MNKRRIQLKESKLSKIIQESIRRVLNESDSKEGTFTAINAELHSCENSYEEGEIGGDNYWDENLGHIKASSVKDLVSKIANEYGFDPKHALVLDGRVILNGLVDKDLGPLSDSEIEKWKQGKMKAYTLEVYFNIVRQSELSHDELVADGLESYD